MSASRRRFSAAILTILATGLVGASLAWACTPLAELVIEPSAGPPGGTVMAKGYAFARNQRVELRWGHPDGQLLAETKATEPGPCCGARNFTQPVEIPRVGDGHYTIVAVVWDPETRKTYKPPAAFEVTTKTSSGPSGGQPQGGNSPGSPAVSGGRLQGARGKRFQGTRGGERSPAGNRAGGDTIASVGPRAASGARVSGGRTGSRIFPGSVPPAIPGAPRTADPAAAANGARAAPAGAGPSERSATGDLWSGFGPGKSASFVPRVTDPEVPGDGPGGQLAVGVGLLGLGLVALVGGLGVAELRRRRAVAHLGVR